MMSRLAAAAAGATTLPSSKAAPVAAVEEDESVLTVAEKGLKRVYDLLREQADALRAAKQAELQSKVAAAKAAAAAGGGSPTAGGVAAGGSKKATAAGPMRPTVSGGSRPVKRPTMAGAIGGVGGGGGGGGMGPGGGLAGHYRPRPSPAVAAFNDDDLDAGSVGSSQSGASGGGQQHMRPRASAGDGGGGGLPKRPSGASSLGGSKSKKQKEAEFSIPRRERALPAHDDGFAIPKRSSSGGMPAMPMPMMDPYGGLQGSAASFDSLQQQQQQPPPLPPEPPVEQQQEEEDERFPVLPGFSLDRGRFDPAYLLRGMGGTPQGDAHQGLLRGWDSREAERPLVVPLQEFGLQPDQRKVLAIRASVPADARRFALNLCPGPLPQEEAEAAGTAAPSEVLAHFNPRRIYKGGSIVHNSRRAGQWVEKGTPAVALAGLPPVFGVTLTLMVTVDKDLISLCMEDAAGSTLPACEILLNVDGSNRGAALASSTELCLHLPVKEETVGFQEEWVVHEVWWGPKVPPPPAPGSSSTATPLGPLPLPPPGAPPSLVHHPMHHHPVAMGGGAAVAAAPFVLPLPPPRPEAAAAPALQQGPAMPAAAMAAASMAAAAAAEVAAGLATKGPIRPRVRSINNHPQQHEPPSVEGGGQAYPPSAMGEGAVPGADVGGADMEAATGRMEERLSRLGGLLGAGGGGGFGGGCGGGAGGFAAGLAALGAGGLSGGGGGGMAVVAVTNLPEPGTAEEAEGIKGDLISLFNQVGGGVQDVHLKPGAATAFVVLADPRDLAEAIRAVDWHEYAGRKLRVARSNKRVF